MLAVIFLYTIKSAGVIFSDRSSYLIAIHYFSHAVHLQYIQIGKEGMEANPTGK